MLVNTLLNNGVTIPTISANTGDSTKPAINTGMCIGKNTGPPAPTAWNAIGSITPRAINNPAITTSLVLLFLIFCPPTKKTE
jgi:hypothetical protein